MKEKIDQPDTITIETVDDVEIFANRVDIFVTIKGKSLFTGQEAFKKAKEVRELTEGLTSYGLLDEDIFLQSVRAEVSTGVIGKQSSAAYRLRINCRKLDDLADILGIITTQQNTSLEQMVWRYDDVEDHQAKLLESCILKSKHKAENVAGSLGIKLMGVYEFNEQVGDTEMSVLHQPVAARSGAAFKSRPVSKEVLGLSVSHSKRINMRLTIKYRVSPFEAMQED